MSNDIRKYIFRLVDEYFSAPIAKKEDRLGYAKQIKDNLNEETCELIVKGMFKLEILLLHFRIESSERMEIEERPAIKIYSFSESKWREGKIGRHKSKFRGLNIPCSKP